MKTLLIVLFLFVSASGFCQFDSAGFKAAQSLYDSENYEMALASVNRLLAKDNQVAAYFNLRGMIHLELEDRRTAVKDFTQAIQLDSTNYDYFLHRSQVYYSTQNPDLAIEDQNKAIKYLGRSNDSLLLNIVINRGAAEAMRRNFQAAYRDYMLVLKHDSTNFGALNNIGAVLDELGRRNESIPILEKLIRLYPDFKGGYINLAFQCVETGDYKRALMLNNKAIELDPEEPLGYNNRGYVKYKMNDLQGALADINTSLKMYPTNSYAYRNRALVYLAMKQPKKACADLEEAKKQGFSEMYGDEVEKLLRLHCFQM